MVGPLPVLPNFKRKTKSWKARGFLFWFLSRRVPFNVVSTTLHASCLWDKTLKRFRPMHPIIRDLHLHLDTLPLPPPYRST